MKKWLFPLIPLGLALALLVAAGCGSSSENENADGVATAGGKSDAATAGENGKKKEADPYKAALDFARCMREHGVDMPDPTFDDHGGARIMIGRAPDATGSRGPESETEIDKEAHEACKHLLEEGMLGPGGKPDPEMQERALKFAACMREHGVNVPDPTFDEGGSGTAFELGDGHLDPSSPTFREAEKACQEYFGPEHGPGGGGAGLAPSPGGRES